MSAALPIGVVPWAWCLVHIDEIARGMPATWVSQEEVRPAVIERIDRTDHSYPDFMVESRDLRSDSVRTFTLTPLISNALPRRLPARWPLTADEFYCAPRCGRFFLVVGWASPPLCRGCSGLGEIPSFGSFRGIALPCAVCDGEGYAQ